MSFLRGDRGIACHYGPISFGNSGKQLNPRAPSRHRQSGVALIIALVLVALATILATKLSIDGRIERQRTLGVLATEQALQFAMGGEALAANVLSNGQTGGPDTLADSWAQPTQPMPLTSDNTPDGEPLGTLQGTLEDMQGRFNLNSLLRVLPNGKPDPFPLEQFQRLLVSVGLEPKWAGIARDWVDADDLPGVPDGAEDAVYTSQFPPYRAANWPMTSSSELMALPGFGADRYRKISPYVTALPSPTAAINICTAPAPVLESLAASLNGEYSGNPDFLSKGRKSGCFPDLATFRNILGQDVATKLAGRFGDKTSYFQLTTRVAIGKSEFKLYSLLQRGTGGKVTPLLRTFGTY